LGIQAQSAAAKRIELTGFVQPTVTTQLRGDPGRLGQVLNNLLSNAVKFTHKGEVGIRVTQESETKTHVTLRLEVKDSGIGIPPEAQGRLFQAFIQADGSTTRRYGGTGLGLVICRQLVNMMNGQIGLRSALGQGSTFWFLVPFEKQPISPKPEKAEGVQLSKVRVLAVDDNETNRQVLHHQLEGWRMRNDCVGSGPEALAKLREAQTTDPYGLAILDLQMPEMDGLTLAREIKADPAIAKTALIMLTSMDQQLEPDIMASVGISACLMKPVRQSRLLDVLVNVVSQGGLPVSLVGVLGVAKPGVARSLPPRDTRILLAEDNIINQKVALGQLEELGYRADVAANGREVLEALDRQDYDIILMDCQMPEMDGYEATRQIRSREQELARSGRKKPALHIIAMTAHAMHGDREKCLQAGMNDYISKPVDDEELQTALSRWQPPAKPETPPVKPEAPPATPTLPPSGVTPPVGAATSAVGGAGVAEAPPVNFKRLNRVALGDKAKVRELVELYLTQAEQLMKRIEAGLQAGSAKEVEQAAHKLCGSSASCGIESVVAPLRELERMGREGHLGEATPKFAEAVRQMERARHSLGQHLESVS
jgi:CheY-like chemotaxis protein/HPt (histidine-containing phosphotransfer) domain-containing protein